MPTLHEMRVEVEIRSSEGGWYTYAVWVPGTRKPEYMTDSSRECRFGYTRTYRGALRAAKRAAKRVKRTSAAWVVHYQI